METITQTDGRKVIYGDAHGVLASHAQAGDETISDSGFFLTIYGDSDTITGSAAGGQDNLLAIHSGVGDSATAVGDAHTITGHGRGGDDTLQAGGTVVGGSALFGDAREMSGHAVGGDDLLLGAGPRGAEYGDAETLSGHVQCGNDTLISVTGLPFGDEMYGDGKGAADHVRCGDDVLVSKGNAQDLMWGDAATLGSEVLTGADRFVFAPANGHDEIMDFEPGKDRIELNGFGFASFEDVLARLETTPDGVMIRLGPSDEVLVRGIAVTQLHPADFVIG